MIAKFDPVMQEHVKLVISRQISDHYCGKTIQNEIIHLLVEKVTSRIVHAIKTGKYFSIIADCTSDTSHVEQLSLTIRFGDISGLSENITVQEHVLQF